MKTYAVIRRYRDCLVEVEHDDSLAGIEVAALAIDAAPPRTSRRWKPEDMMCRGFLGDDGKLIDEEP